MKFILLYVVLITCIFTACSQTRNLKYGEIMALETRDEQTVSKVIICFERLVIGMKNDSLQMGGRTFTTDSLPLPGVRIQFGVWKTADEGTYFIIREEFLSDSAGRFDLRTKIFPDEWMVIESETGTRFFDIRGAWE